MPRLKNDEPWVKGFKTALRNSTAKGWQVREHRGKARLEVRAENERGEKTMISAPLKRLKEGREQSFDFSAKESGDILIRVRNIYELVASGHTIKAATEIAAGKAPRLTYERDWEGAVRRFKIQKIEHGSAVDPRATWKKDFLLVLTTTLELLSSGNPPTNPADLIDACIRDWEPGCRTREIRTRSLAAFLKHCVNREGFPPAWIPTTDLRDHIGRKPKGTQSQKMDSISDQEIINLIDSMPTDTGLERYRKPARKWEDALKLMAVYGLRPEELKYLEVRNDKVTGNTFLWCTYEKRSGGGITKPRVLEALHLANDQGEFLNWDLLNRLKTKKIELPPLESLNGAGEAARKYLERRDGWLLLKEQMRERGEKLGVYSLRHSYSVRGHQRGIDAGSMALAMGHSLQTHLQSYPWASDAGRSAAFEKSRMT